MKKLTIKECKKWMRKNHNTVKVLNTVKTSCYGVLVTMLCKYQSGLLVFYTFFQDDKDNSLTYTIKSLNDTVYADKFLMYLNDEEREALLYEMV